MILNNDTRANAQYASYNGLVWKKRHGCHMSRKTLSELLQIR